MSNEVKENLWAPCRKALDEIIDAIAALPLEVQLEHQLNYEPHLHFRARFLQRHPTIFNALEQALSARNRAINEANRLRAKEQRLAKYKQTMAKKKAAREAAQK